MALSRSALALPRTWQRLSPWTRHGKVLPRDARDTLFLLFVLAWTVFPHLARLPLWCGLLSVSVLTWRAMLAWRGEPLPSRWTVLTVLVLAAVLTWTSNSTLLGKEAGVTLLIVLAALKTLELRARRDTFVVFFLGFFLVLTNFLYSQSLLTALLMLVAVWGLLTALVLAHMPVGQPALPAAARLAMRTAALGVPLMALLFLLFPRVAPLWGLPADALPRTGLSGSMSLGSVAELALDNAIALRVAFEGGERPSQALYFRGPVLTRFNGRLWTAAEAGLGLPTQVRGEGRGLSYVMTIEPLRVPVLPLLEITTQAPVIDGAPDGFSTTRHGDLHWSANQPLTDRVRVRGLAYTAFHQGMNAPSDILQEARELPSKHNPRMRAWADEFRTGLSTAGRGTSAPELADALLRKIRTGGYTYTLAPGEYGADVVDEFWLDRKEGFCEHFAAAFVVAMRLFGVPARVVTGYLGGEYNAVDGNLEVRNSDAHAWAEYWMAPRGWVRVDPTAAVAPERVLRGQRLQAPQGLMAEAIGAVNPALLKQMRAVWDALENRWNQSVLNYSRGRQMDMLRWLGVSTPHWEQLAYMLIGTLCALSVAGAVWAWWDRHRVDPWLRAYRRAGRALARRGLNVPEHLPPRALAQLAREAFGPAAQPVCEALLALEQMRYMRAAPQRRAAATLARSHAARAAAAARSLPRLPARDVPQGLQPLATPTPQHA